PAQNSNPLTPHIQGLYTPWPLSVAARPGTCPPDPIRCAHSTPAYCSSDPKCPREQKCCYVTCRFRCVDPAEGTRDGDQRCRPCLANRSCSTCFRDADCPGPEKCCPGQCGTRCWEPVSGKRTYDRPYRVSPLVLLAPYPVLTEARPSFWQSGV
uniref:WAP domain-containing protein n=1 Tax=Gopherus agassizii TaxID=38772 RepID=A0A452GYW1_9SAUR